MQSTDQNKAPPPLRVLLIEDDANDAELILHELQQHGLQCSSQRVWREADLLDALRDFRPEIILSDYAMPSMDGLHALGLAQAQAPHTPFIFVSGTLGEERAVQALKSGAADYVLKGNMLRLGPAVERAAKDVLARQQALRNEQARQQALRNEQARQRLVAIIEATPDFVAICDLDMNLKYLNPGARRLLACNDHPINAPLAASDYLPPELLRMLTDDAMPYAAQYGTWQGEGDLLASNGAHLPVSLRLIVHKTAQREIEFVSLIARDIREKQGYEARIRYLANFDSLTALPNRQLLQDRTNQAIGHCRRSGRSLALLLIDIDRFALINEGLGQSMGDRVIKEVASRICCVARERATVARLSADIFAIVDMEITRADDAMVMASALSAAISQPLQLDHKELELSATIGITVFPRDGDSLSSLLRNADAALRRGKAENRGGIQFYDTRMSDEALRRIDDESKVRNAVKHNELMLYYQPQIELASGRITGVEALVRWMHPEQGLLSPSELIPIAEQIGAIHGIGLWVLETGCQQAAAWHAAGRSPIRMSINVSPLQLRTDRFVAEVARVLQVTGLPPALLELEVTESALIGDLAQSTRMLSRLKALGVSIALDDFGTGYSSLSYLSRLPIDRLKIDCSFVARMMEDAHDQAIVHTILSMAKALGLQVIAEGVESEAQRQHLYRAHCPEAQGYLFSVPLPPNAIDEFVDDYAKQRLKQHRP